MAKRALAGGETRLQPTFFDTLVGTVANAAVEAVERL